MISVGPKTKIALGVGAAVIAVIVILAGIQAAGLSKNRTVPHEGAWGIYSMVLESEEVSLVYSSENMPRDLSRASKASRRVDH